MGLWLVRGVGLGFGIGAGADARPVCVLLRGGLANWGVALAFDPDVPSRCPTLDGGVGGGGEVGPGSVSATGGLAWVVIDGVRDDSPGSLRDAAAIALACVGAALVAGGLFAL